MTEHLPREESLSRIIAALVAPGEYVHADRVRSIAREEGCSPPRVSRLLKEEHGLIREKDGHGFNVYRRPCPTGPPTLDDVLS